MDRDYIILFGDSQTSHGIRQQGWINLLHSILYSLDILPRGFSGYTSRLALHLLPTIFPPRDVAPKLVTVFLGTNDASILEQHVPLGEFKANMKHIVQHIKKTYFDKTKIVLVAPGPFFPVNEDATKRSTNEIHRQYAQACVDVANEEVCASINLWELMSQGKDHGREYMLAEDGLHLSLAGHKLLYDEVIKYFNIEGDMQFPGWRAFNFGDPASNAQQIQTHLEGYNQRRNWTK
jgi:lysophospholipase L1-like esterase